MYFQRGTLTPEQVKLVLRDLPVDISFADENDVLVYWSGATYKTCDARYIGRDVRDCHPEESLACLEEILRAFKSGEKDMAEGWHEEGDTLLVHALQGDPRQDRRVPGDPRGEPGALELRALSRRAGPAGLVTR